MTYLDLNEILMENELVPVEFEVPEILGQNTQNFMNIPCWLYLYMEDCKLFTPKQFSMQVLKMLDAGSQSVDLFQLSPYYFSLAIRLSKDLDAFTMDCLSTAFMERLRKVMDHTQTQLEEHTSVFVTMLDLTERESTPNLT